MQAYYGRPVGTLKDIKALDPDTCEIEIERTLTPDACCALGPGFIGEYDESLITGLEHEYFNPLPNALGITPIVVNMMPMGKAFYIPAEEFSSFWKRLNKQHVGEDIQRIKYTITPTTLTIYIKYARTITGNAKRYEDDVHDLEMELGDTLTNHRGDTLSWPLWEMEQICARKYRKKQSYQGLIGYLKKTYDIDLTIKDY